MNYVYGAMPAAEVLAAEWHKSRFSNPSGNCVEIARLPHRRIAVRDSRNPGGPALVFTASAWVAFLQAVRSDTAC